MANSKLMLDTSVLIESFRKTKEGSIHALRHTCATHLRNKRTDITYIQNILGHNDLKTTLRYLHVTTRDLHKIISPLEDLGI